MAGLKLATALTLIAMPVFAEEHASGDAEAGANAFNRQCGSCHVVTNAEGDVLAGRNGRVGPNLFAITGGLVAGMDGFRYGEAIIAAREAGAVWDEENFVAYVQDPTAWLRDVLDDPRARSKMSFRVRSEEDASNLYAFLATFSAEAQ